jgi:hypothetical protein
MALGIEQVNRRVEQVKKDTGHGQVVVKIKDRKIVFIESRLDEEGNRS